MKNLKYLSLFLCTLFFLSACEKETENVSGILHFELLGEQTMLVTLGTSYQEPGYKVVYRDQDVTDEIKIVGTVDAAKVGLYNLNYTYTNPDGVRTTVLRTVIVADPTVTRNIAGNYVTVNGTFRLRQGVITNYPGFDVTIDRIAPGFFKISDFLGGYYDQRAKYGVAYACSGYVQLKNDNTLTLLSSSILPWGDTLTGVTEGQVDPNTDAISWKAEYAGMIFTVVLNKK